MDEKIEKKDDEKSLVSFLRDKKNIRVLIFSLVFIVLLLLVLHIFPKQEPSKDLNAEVSATKDLKAENNQTSKEFSTFGDGVSEKIFIKDVEKDISNITSKYEEQKSTLKEISEQQSFLAEYLQKLDNTIKKVDERLSKIETSQTLSSLQNQLIEKKKTSVELESIKILPVEEISVDKELRLPIGSYAKGTLLTGVYAPTDSNNPLPVLIRLEEAFVGPNNSRVPLKGTFLIGKAYGDFTTKRALVQIVSISTVMQDGRTFEKEGSFGYLTDDSHLFGIPGLYVENTGKQLGLSFLSGFMSGTSQAFADNETTSLIGSSGQITKVVTGDSGKNAAFQGLASSASQMSEYYQKQLEKIVPAVQVDAGKTVYFYVQKGVTIEGLKLTDNTSVKFID